MNKLILLITLVLGVKTTYAECSMNGMEFYPEQNNISLNSMFIIQGYFTSQKTINSFKERDVFLKSENGRTIKLNLQKILKGNMYITQAIFKPSKELKPNTTYYLKYSDQTKREESEMIRYNRKKVYWTTTNKKTTTNLNSNITFKFNKTELVQYGCGPSIHAIFDVKNNSKNDIWFKTEVVEITSNKRTVYYLKELDGKLNIGHGMCAGAFTFRQKGKYKVRFTAINTNGNTLKTGYWIPFKNPLTHHHPFSIN